MEFSLEVVTLAVRDVDEAKAFYTAKLGFALDVDYHPRDGFRVGPREPGRVQRLGRHARHADPDGPALLLNGGRRGRPVGREFGNRAGWFAAVPPQRGEAGLLGLVRRDRLLGLLPPLRLVAGLPAGGRAVRPPARAADPCGVDRARVGHWCSCARSS